MLMKRSMLLWRVAEWILFAIWMTAAAATMYPAFGRALHLYGTLFTSYAADLTNPAWLYILVRRRPPAPVRAPWFGRAPAATAAAIFVAGTITELTQAISPAGPFRGTYDPVDILAFATGLSICFLADRRAPIGIPADPPVIVQAA